MQYDADGRAVITPLTDRLIAIDAAALQAVPEVIAIAYDAAKAEAVGGGDPRRFRDEPGHRTGRWGWRCFVILRGRLLRAFNDAVGAFDPSPYEWPKPSSLQRLRLFLDAYEFPPR